MDALILALAPGFVAGFAVQRLLEVLNGLLDLAAKLGLTGDDAKPESPKFKSRKAMWANLAAIFAGVAIVWLTPIRVLHPLDASVSSLVDGAVTALVISAGTEGINSILKYLGYKKDKADEEATKTAKEAAKA